MKIISALQQFQISCSAFWAVRNVRERWILALAGVVLIALLSYVVLIAPALNGREQLNKNLPTLRQQVTLLQSLSNEAASLVAKPVLAAPTLSKESIEASLARKDLKMQSVSLTGDVVKLQLASVSFAGTLSWLDEMQNTAQLSAVDVNIVVLPTPDTVNATLTLRQRRND